MKWKSHFTPRFIAVMGLEGRKWKPFKRFLLKRQPRVTALKRGVIKN